MCVQQYENQKVKLSLSENYFTESQDKFSEGSNV